MSRVATLRVDADAPTVLQSYAIIREAANTIKDRSQLPLRRAVKVLRGTPSRIVLCRVDFWGEVDEECGVLLNRMFGHDAMIEQIDDSSYALLFVRSQDDEDCVEGMVMKHLAQTIQPAFGRRFRATLSVSHFGSDKLRGPKDLIAEFEAKGPQGAKIVTF